MTSYLPTHAEDYPMYVYIDISLDQDAPTVADYTPPYATAQDAKPTDNGEISLSMISKAWAHTTGFYTEM